MFVFFQEQGIDVCFQSCMKTMVVSGRIVDVIVDPSVYVRVTDGISRIMADKSSQISDSLGSLLPGVEPGKMGQITAEKIIDMVLMHIRAYISVIPVP